MSSPDRAVINAAVRFAGKFGFLTQEIFFNYLCPKSRAAKYVCWKALVTEGYFRPSTRNARLYYLAPKGVVAAGPLCVRRRYFYHIDHDSVGAALFLELSLAAKIANAWSEPELRSNPWDAHSILGASDLVKIPDLVLDLDGHQGLLRVAFEVEASRKSFERYEQIAFNYLAMKNIKLIIYLCENQTLRRQIECSFAGPQFHSEEKIPATLLLRDFKTMGLDAPSKFYGREIKLRDLLSKASGIPLEMVTTSQDALKTGVLSEPSQNGEVAA